MSTYEIIESRVWQRDDGKRASIYGAVPWQGQAERARWQQVTTGYTVRDMSTNTVGIGRMPWVARPDVEQWILSRGCERCVMHFDGNKAPVVARPCEAHTGTRKEG